VVSKLLKVNPSERLSCDQILKLKEVKSRLNDSKAIGNGHGQLLGTIQIPKNMNDLKGKFPKSKY
jgi:hypothetical protein